MPIITAIVKTFDQANHKADIVPQAYPSGLWPSVPIGEFVDGELITAGSTVAVEIWEDGRALILGPFGGRPTPPISGRVNITAGFNMTIGSWVDYTNLTLDLTTTVTSHIWASAQFSWVGPGSVLALRALSRIVVNSTNLNLVWIGQPLADLYDHLNMFDRTPTAVAPGTHTVKVQTYQYAGTALACNEATLIAWAWPA